MFLQGKPLLRIRGAGGCTQWGGPVVVDEKVSRLLEVRRVPVPGLDGPRSERGSALGILEPDVD
jgi:hypothetical protein